MLLEEHAALSEGAVVDEIPLFAGRSSGENVLFSGRGSVSEGVGGLTLVSSSDSTFLVAGDRDSDAEVALLPRDWGREESKELDEEVV